MKNCPQNKNYFILAAFCFFAVSLEDRTFAQIYGAYWSFNDNTPANWTTAAPTVNTLPSANLVRTGSALNNYNNTAVMGAATYTAFDASTHIFNQDTGNRRSMAWDIGSTGNTFTIQLNTTGYENFVVRLDYRRGTVGTAPTVFDALEYSLDSGVSWISISGYPSLGTASNVYTAWSHDLSTISAIENTSNVWLRWSFATVEGNNFRIDNVEITGVAIPEPSQIVLLSFAAVAIYAVSRKMLKNRQA